MSTHASNSDAKSTSAKAPQATVSRRQFLKDGGAAVAAVSIVPRHVLGGRGYVAPSEKLTLACIGFGTQAIREIGMILASPEIQVVAVCDVEKDGAHYLEWDKGEVRNNIRMLLKNPAWREGQDFPPGGRDVGKEVVETYYAQQRGKKRYKGCATYVDFRELLEKEKDLDAVKVMTPDHLHATVALAALKKGKHVVMHKPIGNRLLEARKVIETAGAMDIATHFLPASNGARQQPVFDMVKNGAIGTLREIHNWSSRPMWPQFATIPADTPPVPEGFDWTLWLGPSLDRPYHPNYTHTNFRGWYEFGGGAIADMGHYSLWPFFQHFDLDSPYSVESTPTHVCAVADQVCRRIDNDYSFPTACTVRMRFAAKGERGPIDIFWYDGGIRPRVPDELMADGGELQSEGMLLVGDTGMILGDFRCEMARLLPESKMRAYEAANKAPQSTESDDNDQKRKDRVAALVKAFKGGPPTFGDFRLAVPICDAMNLAAVSLRLGGRRLLWDSASARITNNEDANGLLTREYRAGWEM
ncbi:MAG: Gfo/Idh/MocA family oxidoreductase [Candidatus Hydrogenedentes bacterium]|nr:Gfo/Idh/MocA family oxidoreductase [Candidatus Hydrogenedentota bacterium]